MPGLPKGPFLENRVKRPDSIRGKYDAHSARGVRYAVFRIWVNFPFGNGYETEWGGSEKKACQNAIRGIRTHYMHLNFWVFQRLGPAMGSVYRRWRGVTTVAGEGVFPAVCGCGQGIFRKNSGRQKIFLKDFLATIFLKKIFSGKSGKNLKEFFVSEFF